MRLLGAALSESGLPFIVAQATHAASGVTGTVVCETQEQCDAVVAWAEGEDWSVTTRVATAEEVALAKHWRGR